MLDIIQRRFEGCRRLPRDDVLQLVDGEPPIEIDKPPDKPPIPADVEISLCSLTGASSPTTIRFNTSIRQERVVVHVDHGSSHKFVSREVAEKLFLKARPIPPFEVKVANGDCLVCNRCFEVVPIEVQGTRLVVDLFELPIHGLEVVFGVHWLKELAPMTINWQLMTIRFKYNGVWVTLQGIREPTDRDTNLAKRQHGRSGWGREDGSGILALSKGVVTGGFAPQGSTAATPAGERLEMESLRERSEKRKGASVILKGSRGSVCGCIGPSMRGLVGALLYGVGHGSHGQVVGESTAEPKRVMSATSRNLGGFEGVRNRELTDGYRMIDDQGSIAIMRMGLKDGYFTSSYNSMQRERRNGDVVNYYIMQG
ncbi:unnamed protein product [Linum trigynum]|uniref:Polyprotein n=1 Tax=Linum trigynum TaxID=586398 RepID=A0AAV2FBF3_9ROSI